MFRDDSLFNKMCASPLCCLGSIEGWTCWIKQSFGAIIASASTETPTLIQKDFKTESSRTKGADHGWETLANFRARNEGVCGATCAFPMNGFLGENRGWGLFALSATKVEKCKPSCILKATPRHGKVSRRNDGQMKWNMPNQHRRSTFYCACSTKIEGIRFDSKS